MRGTNRLRSPLALVTVVFTKAPLILSASLLLAACRSSSSAIVSDAESIRTAQAALGPFRTSLSGALQKAMAESPEAAIDVCSSLAPALAIAHSRPGVTLGRSATKLRNQANAARPWLGPVMERLAKAPSGSAAHEVVSLGGDRRGYAEAIWTAPMCLNCHGDSVSPTIAAKLDARYPNDQARGFRAGDFRGVFWAELDASSRAP